MGEGVDLVQGEEFGAFAVVATHLVEGFGHAFEAGGRFHFGQQNGEAIDEQAGVQADAVRAVEVAEFIGDVVGVVFPPVGEQADVQFPTFFGDKDGFEAAQVFPRFQVAFDAGQDAFQPAGEVFGTVNIYNAAIELLHLGEEDVPEEQAIFAAPELVGVVAGEESPARFLGIAEEGELDGGEFGAEAEGRVGHGSGLTKVAKFTIL